VTFAFSLLTIVLIGCCFGCLLTNRELPGFGHTRLLLSTVADELQAWQLQVDEAVSQAFNAYTSTANALAMKMTQQVASNASVADHFP
jgi:hypothetical protein